MAPNYALRRTVVLVGLAGVVWGVQAAGAAVVDLVTPDETAAVVSSVPVDTPAPADAPAPVDTGASGDTTAPVDTPAPVDAPAPIDAPAWPAPSSPPAPAPLAGDDPVTLSFAGDTHFEKQLAAVAQDPNGLASLQSYLGAADVTVLNLETAIASGGSPLGGKEFTFAAPPSALTTLANAGVDAVSMANNHAVDHGAAGLAETLAARASSPVKLVGIGANAAEAYEPAVFTVDGVSIAVLAGTQLRDQTTAGFTATDTKPGVASMVDPARLVAAVRDATSRHDIVIVVPHWGIEKELCPTPAQFEATRLLSEAGADAIIGSHSHRVMAGGWSGATYVNYGLGNFVWFLNTTFPGRSTGVLTIDVDKAAVAARRAAPASERAATPVVVKENWTPLLIPESGIPQPDAATAAQMLADRAGVRGCAKLAEAAPGASAAVSTSAVTASASAPPDATTVSAPREPSNEPATFQGIPIVSRAFPVTKEYVPAWAGEKDGLHPDVRAALDRLIADAKAEGLRIALRSGYRDWATQDASWKRAYASYGEGARRYYAEAGRSEHQTGLAVDVSDGRSSKGYSFKGTPQAAWVAANASRYGFIVRYPEGKRDITGVDHEPWHLRYVGLEVAATMAERPGLTLEEFLGLA